MLRLRGWSWKVVVGQKKEREEEQQTSPRIGDGGGDGGLTGLDGDACRLGWSPCHLRRRRRVRGCDGECALGQFGRRWWIGQLHRVRLPASLRIGLTYDEDVRWSLSGVKVFRSQMFQGLVAFRLKGEDVALRRVDEFESPAALRL